MRFLVVDDVTEWATQLDAAVTTYFVQGKRFAKARVRGFTAYDAGQADDHIANGGWDLVLLDMNLGDGAQRGGRGRISGLDLLGDIARGNRAYFVIIVTGAVTDPDLERVYGREEAALMRFGAANEAVKQMPATRVRILHKPPADSVTQAMATILPHLHSALDQYCSVSLERNIFRALPGDPALVEICYNGGPRLTLPFDAPFRTIQSALAQPNRMLKVTELIQRIARSSGPGAGPVVLAATSPAPTPHPTILSPDDEVVCPTDALDCSDMSGFGISSTLYQHVDTPDGSIRLELIVGALLFASRQGRDLATTMATIVEEMNIDETALLGIPANAKEWARRPHDADAEFEIENAAEALRRLVDDLRPLLEPIARRWRAAKESAKGVTSRTAGPQAVGRKKLRVATRMDTREMQVARQHWARFKKTVAKHPALKEFHDHIVRWVDRNPTSRGHLYYRPPQGGEFWPFWLTE